MFRPRSTDVHRKQLEAERSQHDYDAQCRALVERLATMPDTDEDMLSTFAPPDWDDLCDWWREFVREARKITGKSYYRENNATGPV